MLIFRLKEHLKEIIKLISQIENIINKQATREERISIADEVILNNGSLEHLRKSVLNIHKKYMEIVKNG